jgi:hypothetical protein
MDAPDTSRWTLDGVAKLGWPVTRSPLEDDCLVLYGDWIVAVLHPLHPDGSVWWIKAERSSVWRTVKDVAVWGRDELDQLPVHVGFGTETSGGRV